MLRHKQNLNKKGKKNMAKKNDKAAKKLFRHEIEKDLNCEVVSMNVTNFGSEYHCTAECRSVERPDTKNGKTRAYTFHTTWTGMYDETLGFICSEM